jgi:NAD(P)-dependent dehydrogenase (short-subunit alcohol dehydrogenase family)
LRIENGTKIVYGDVSDGPGRELESELDSSSAFFVQCDVTSYSDQLALFKKAQTEFGRVDIVVANAGIVIPQDPFAPDADISKEPSMKEVDVNLKGVMFTARIGMAYLRKSGGGDLILVSSIAGFKESPGLTPYLASKHGVIGILRGLRMSALPEGIRVNAICPWMTSKFRATSNLMSL